MADREVMPTASRMPKIVTNDGKLRATKAVTDYALEIVYRRLGARVDWTSGSMATEHGITYEPWTLDQYQRRNFCKLRTDQKFYHRKVDGLPFGATPDAVISTGSIRFPHIPVEVKNPYNGTNHLATIFRNTVPEEYYAQVQTQILVLDAPYGIFISSDPRLDDPLDIFEIRVEPDDTFKFNFYESLWAFWQMIKQFETTIKQQI